MALSKNNCRPRSSNRQRGSGRIEISGPPCAPGLCPDEPHRWLHVHIASPQSLAILALHAPNRSSGRKYPFLNAVTDAARAWRGTPSIVIGDSNSGRIGIDEETPAFNTTEDRWMSQMVELGWRDAFRTVHAERREYTWYSPNGNNGFRIDQAFLHPRLVPRLTAVAHHWGGGILVVVIN